MTESDSPRSILIMQWIVIAVLVLGGGLALWMVSSKAVEYQSEVNQQAGNVKSLREQVRQAQGPQSTRKPLTETTSAREASPTLSPTKRP